MATLLLGPNFSGRSKWLADRRSKRPWPEVASLGPFPDLACTGLTSTVSEELTIASAGRSVTPDLTKEFGLGELFDHELYALSGGEAVRVALSSVVAQGVDELQIDTSLEQLDEDWRRITLTLLSDQSGQIANKVFVADNQMTEVEVGAFGSHLRFPLNAARPTQWSEAINPESAAANVNASNSMISLRDVSFSYSRRSPTVLSRVSLDLEPGLLYFLLGPNGSGKTTFVKMLSGTILPQEGVMHYGPDRFKAGNSRYRFAGLAFQNPDFQWTTQTVAGELRRARRDKNERAFAVQELLLAFGIPAEVVHHNPNELPFVLKKRLGIALAVFVGRPWIILDEPTLGQDHKYRTALAEFIRLALRASAGVIIISHDIHFRSLFAEPRNLLFRNRTIFSQ